MALTVPSRAVLVGIALVLYAGCMLYSNPIRFHQTAHAGGLTMQVPSNWTPMKSPGKYVPVSLRRRRNRHQGYCTIPGHLCHLEELSSSPISRGTG